MTIGIAMVYEVNHIIREIPRPVYVIKIESVSLSHWSFVNWSAEFLKSGLEDLQNLDPQELCFFSTLAQVHQESRFIAP